MSGFYEQYWSDTQTWHPVIAVSGELNSESETSHDKSLAEVVAAVGPSFQEPLEAVCVNLLVLQDQITEIVEYAQNYLSIVTE